MVSNEGKSFVNPDRNSRPDRVPKTYQWDVLDGPSIKHLKAIPSKTKKAPKRGNCHSPLWTHLIGTINYILAPTKHLENFIITVPFVFTREYYIINK
jgi:hypothetical protein